jgi:TPR repeat protein
MINLTLKHVAAAIILVLGFAATAAAGPLEDADAALKRRDYATAVRLNRPLAEQGNANAQYNLGTFYDNGLGVPQDKVRAYIGGARQRRCGSFARPYRTAHDPRADSRSAEARSRVDVKYAVAAFSLERLTAIWLKKLASLCAQLDLGSAGQDWLGEPFAGPG